MGAEELWACSGRRTRQVHCSVADSFFLGRPSLQRRRRIGNRKEDSLREGEREREREREEKRERYSLSDIAAEEKKNL